MLLNQDLNRIKKKPYTETVEDRGRPDEVVANEAWEIHKKRNNSFVVDLFQGQYKSKLVCPVCGRVRKENSHIDILLNVLIRHCFILLAHLFFEEEKVWS